MPPRVAKKRLRAESPEPSKSRNGESLNTTPARKPTLFDDLDATASSRATGDPAFALSQLAETQGDDDDESELSSLSDTEFEDVPFGKRPRLDESDEDEDETDDDIEFEDVPPSIPLPTEDTPVPSGDLELTLRHETRYSLSNAFGNKKGPSKIERRIRSSTHRLHVSFLLWHNAVRNAWLCDPELQATMMSHIPPRLCDEIDRWRRRSGLETATGKEDAPEGKGKRPTPTKSRDWSEAALRLDRGAVDLSHGDPLFRLMQSLSAWWKKRFRVTAPGCRKVGYMSLERLGRLTKDYSRDPTNTARFGERIRSLEEFRECARQCEGSRDVGAQLFTAMLRAIGLEARMVASLQPLGFGWSKPEDAEPETEAETEKPAIPAPKQGAVKPVAPKVSRQAVQLSRKAHRKAVIKFSDDELMPDIPDSSDEDDKFPDLKFTPRKVISKDVYDTDLDFPHYWTEVLSPVTNKYVPVEAFVKKIVATNRELIESLEPRGARAEKAKQVIAYVVGFSPDGTAKDVTVRYLKRQTLPGRTKGTRYPVEKVPVYNKRGKVKRYDEVDFFRCAMMGYLRGGERCPLTEADQLEDESDLVPLLAEKKEVKEGEETLQYYKTSKEYALQRHLKREEALLPDAKPVRTFRTKSKGKILEEDVYLRSEVVQVKSAETWHKQGRAPIPGEMPLKRVPYRAATTNRRREIAEAEAASGEKVLQGLYSFDQTDWIIPPPIRDGVIPKNEYGNIDLFVEHMCPPGAVHVPYRGAVRVCKRLKVDYAEAVIDFEFGHRMAVPVIQGVVVAEEYYDDVMRELQKDEEERARKEDEKRRKAALGMWRRLLMGLRIAERIRIEYGHIGESVSVFGHHQGPTQPAGDDPSDVGGGFIPEGFEEDVDLTSKPTDYHASSFFPSVQEDDEDGDGDLVVEDFRAEQGLKDSVAGTSLDEDEDETTGSTRRGTYSKGSRLRN